MNRKTAAMLTTPILAAGVLTGVTTGSAQAVTSGGCGQQLGDFSGTYLNAVRSATGGSSTSVPSSMTFDGAGNISFPSGQGSNGAYTFPPSAEPAPQPIMTATWTVSSGGYGGAPTNVNYTFKTDTVNCYADPTGGTGVTSFGGILQPLDSSGNPQGQPSAVGPFYKQ